MTALETMIREVIRDEIRRLVRSDALAANGNEPDTIEIEDEFALRHKAIEAASRLRRARSG